MRSTQIWQEATVVAARDLTPTVREFEIPPTEGLPATWESGAHLQMQLLVNGQVQIRS